jgi:fibronectin-binding autotransporter adhesin
MAGGFKTNVRRIGQHGMPRALPWLAQALGLCLVGSLLPGVAVGQTTLTWGPSGAGGSGNWGTAGAWYTGTSSVAWSNGNNAVFAGTSGTVTMGGSRTAGDVLFDTPGYVVEFGAITLTLSSFSGTALGSTTFVGGTAAGSQLVRLSTASDIAFNGTIANNPLGGNTSFAKQGTGRLTLASGFNQTATGGLTLNEGFVRLNVSTGLPTTWNFENIPTGRSAVLELNAGNLSGLLGTGGFVFNDAADLAGFAALGSDRTFTATNTADIQWGNSGNNQITVGQLILSSTTSTGKLTLASSGGRNLRLATNTAAANTYTRTIRADNGSAPIDAEITMPILNGTSASAIGALTKTGSGVLALSAVNGYTGATSVSEGGLLVNGTTAAASAVTVSSGAFLGGTGFVGGAVTVNGAIAPGSNGIGTLTTGSGVTWNSGNSWLFSLGTPAASLAAAVAGTNNDYLNVGGAFNGSGGSYTFDFANSGSDGWYKLVGYSTTNFSTGTSTQFSASNVPSGKTATFVVDSSSSAVYVQIVPEPATIILAGMGVVFAGLVARQRRRV